MSATSDLDKKLTDHLTGVATYAAPTLYLALLSADPGKAGSQVSEIVGGGYARQSLAGKMSAADAVTGESVNVSAINFGPATAAWSVSFLGITDALTGGNIEVVGYPTVPKTIAIGAPFQIAPGQLRLRTN